VAEVRGGDDVRALLDGDAGQVAALKATIVSVVRHFRLSDPALVEDLVQDVLARVFAALREGRFQGRAALTTYTFGVTRFVCLEHLRRRREGTPLNPDTIASSSRWAQPEEALLRAEEHQENLRALAAMTSECRELFRMIFLEDLTYQEIARRLGISAGAVKTRVRRCRLTGPRPKSDTT
jgi:RNA polymerase sigma factor (sigma-70 family)